MLDSDPRFFLPVLNFLRRGEVIVDPSIAQGVLAEAKYFGIEPLVQRLGGSMQGGEVTWDDIGGLHGVKKELQATVGDSVRYAELFEQCGVSPSKNLLLYGPPGCGKTLLAKVCPFLPHISLFLFSFLLLGDGSSHQGQLFDDQVPRIAGT